MANIVGTSFRDFIHRTGDGFVPGGADNEIATVTVGADNIDAGIGDDFVHADGGNDNVVAGSGNDLVIAASGDDTVTGGDGVDTVRGGQGTDSLSGSVGNDLFLIETASDIDGLAEFIDGGADFDELNFSTFNAGGPIDLSAATISGIERLSVTTSPDITLTASQLGSFSEIIGGFGTGRFVLSAAGTADLTGAAIVNFGGEFRGTAGNDGFVFTGGAGQGVTVNGLNGLDTLLGGNGADVLNGGSGNDSVSGDAANDRLLGELGFDTIDGGFGNDTLIGGTNADSLAGGDGNDAFQVALVSDLHGQAETIDGGNNLDTLDFQALNAGGAVNIAAATLAGVEQIALSANDLTLTAAQLGAFTGLFGGFGFDRLILSAAGNADLTGATVSGIDEIRGSAGNDRITLTDVAAGLFVDGRAGNDTVAGGDAADNLVGGLGFDTIAGGEGNDTLEGGQGADNIFGGIGNDTFRIRQVSDISGLADTVTGGFDVDRLDFQNFNAFGTVDLSLVAFSGVEELFLSGNSATLTAAQLGGFELIQGNFGFDRLLLAAAGTADFTGSQLVLIDEIRGTAGNDQVILAGVDGGQLVNGLNGSDTLAGGDGADRLNGGNQNDSLTGGAGNDTLTGGFGFDRLDGGTGADTFDFNDVAESPAGATRDQITGFVHGQDILNLADIDANSEVAGDQGFTFIGAGAFTGVAGQLRYSGGSLLGDLDGDSVAEFQVALAGSPVVTASDIVP